MLVLPHIGRCLHGLRISRSGRQAGSEHTGGRPPATRVFSRDEVHGVWYLEHAVADVVALQVAPLVADVAADPVPLLHQPPALRFRRRHRNVVAGEDAPSILLDSLVQAPAPHVVVGKELGTTCHQIGAIPREVSGDDLMVGGKLFS